MKAELDLFYSGFEACKPIHFNKHGSDEVLVGRAGYLSGIYWLNERLPSKPFQPTQIHEICSSMLASGREYSQKNQSSLPLMYQYHGSEYLGAAHGVCAILLVLLQSPMLMEGDCVAVDEVKRSIDAYLGEYSRVTSLSDDLQPEPFSLCSTARRRRKLPHRPE